MDEWQIRDRLEQLEAEAGIVEDRLREELESINPDWLELRDVKMVDSPGTSLSAKGLYTVDGVITSRKWEDLEDWFSTVVIRTPSVNDQGDYVALVATLDYRDL